ncbi:Lrp/AsnC family transcriptional regulator [Neoroseomonas soli]|uniref:Lrp/AsnC family transcriptional regulator n=1 Tax=Neoroseomonas soli TaxID=1081025 RepID=UPI001FECC5D3|nr:winged helix-turn-helix transcriptional regulator [Neoroseomonas soli]
MLQRKRRITSLELADRNGLSPTAASERTRRLVKDGFGARLDPQRLGFGPLFSWRCCPTGPRPTPSISSPLRHAGIIQHLIPDRRPLGAGAATARTRPSRRRMASRGFLSAR